MSIASECSTFTKLLALLEPQTGSASLGFSQ